MAGVAMSRYSVFSSSIAAVTCPLLLWAMSGYLAAKVAFRPSMAVSAAFNVG